MTIKFRLCFMWVVVFVSLFGACRIGSEDGKFTLGHIQQGGINMPNVTNLYGTPSYVQNTANMPVYTGSLANLIDANLSTYVYQPATTYWETSTGFTGIVTFTISFNHVLPIVTSLVYTLAVSTIEQHIDIGILSSGSWVAVVNSLQVTGGIQTLTYTGAWYNVTAIRLVFYSLAFPTILVGTLPASDLTIYEMEATGTNYYDSGMRIR